MPNCPRSVRPDFVLAGRGYGILFRSDQVNHCPGCGKSHWHVGRLLAECAFCATAVPLDISRPLPAYAA
jgi:hypothetical protein